MKHPRPHNQNTAGATRGGAPYWWNGGAGPPVADRPPIPPVLHAHFNATTASGDSRLLIVSLLVAGARRPLRALLDSGATNNFFRASCLPILPTGVPVRDLPGDVVIKLADGKPRRVARREVSLSYTFDGFHSCDDFIVLEMNYAFDCILGIPWLARYQPQIDWLARSVKRRQDFDVSEVFTHLLVASRDWPHVTVVDGESKTHVVRRSSDGPLCTTCAVLLTSEDESEHARRRARERQTRAHSRVTRMQNEAVEQRLPHENEAVELGLPQINEAVEQGLPHENEAVEQELPQINEAVEQRLPHENEAVEQELPQINEAVEQGLPQINEAVEQRLPNVHEAVEQRLPHDHVAVGTVPPPRVIGAVANELSRLEEGASSSSESDTSVSSRGSRRTKTPRRSRRRLKPRRDASPSPDPTESVCTIEYVDGVPSHTHVIEVASPPRDAKSITSLPGLSWKNCLRELKAGVIEKVCLITDAESAPRVINSIELSDASSRPKSAEPKSALEKRFAAQSWEALKASGNPVYETAREFADVFPDKIPAVLPADRGVRHEIDLAPGAKYCVTRQWPLPRGQVKAIHEFFEGRRQAGHVRESTSPHSSPTFCLKKATGGWRIVHAFNKLNDATIPAQTPIPRKDMVLDSMSGSVIFSAIDLTDGFYQILMRESDIPLTAVSTPSGMLWE
ncbi:unnamed protein product [Phytophthora fragariaefolia]|uniref:Unnamed protein product n=1 Tax=Phytophthora fragariaefolia TaxID=1490495 RepID=A0A9W6XL42_9STRA|nr:unnamed protein product [Phytophthora fragariaefolia]